MNSELPRVANSITAHAVNGEAEKAEAYFMGSRPGSLLGKIGGGDGDSAPYKL